MILCKNKTVHVIYHSGAEAFGIRLALFVTTSMHDFESCLSMLLLRKQLIFEIQYPQEFKSITPFYLQKINLKRKNLIFPMQYNLLFYVTF